MTAIVTSVEGEKVVCGDWYKAGEVADDGDDDSLDYKVRERSPFIYFHQSQEIKDTKKIKQLRQSRTYGTHGQG